MEKIIQIFQDYIAENRKNLIEHQNKAEEANCQHEVNIVKLRLDDLFLIQYRLEQLLSQNGYKNLCRLKLWKYG